MALGSTRLREVENDSNGTNIIKRAKKYKRNSPGISSESNLLKNILQNKAIDKLGGYSIMQRMSCHRLTIYYAPVLLLNKMLCALKS